MPVHKGIELETSVVGLCFLMNLLNASVRFSSSSLPPEEITYLSTITVKTFRNIPYLN